MYLLKKDLIAYARLNFMRLCMVNLFVFVASLFLGVNGALDTFLFICFNVVSTSSYIAIVGYPRYLVLQLTPKSDAGKYKYHSANAMLPFTKRELMIKRLRFWVITAPILLGILVLIYSVSWTHIYVVNKLWTTQIDYFLLLKDGNLRYWKDFFYLSFC